ncbi:hypothetical protein Ahy_A06g028841 [Arachis hypogaea]|uniref:SWIM-type domain-containing protein n=1 Tax=Arachis hypogaea TaxID=3818 RepID=A0A445CRZ5_ARAHY|nr:hypothetical protein Ahy_A06g028841 [Arachis hypogaea]
MIELYVEFEQHTWMDTVSEEVNVDELGDIDWEEDNNDSEEEFEANYEVDDKSNDEDLVEYLAVQNEAHAIVSEGNVAAEDDKFSVRMKFGYRESVISAIKSYTISREVGYTVYESDPQTFYAKFKAILGWNMSTTIITKGLKSGVRHILNGATRGGCWHLTGIIIGDMMTNLVECIDSVLKGACNLLVTTMIRPIFYRLNELLTQKSVEAHERVRNGFTYSEFGTKRVESFRRTGNIVVNQFDRRNEIFEFREIQDDSIYTVNLAQRHCDCGHFQVERLPYRHVLVCCAN